MKKSDIKTGAIWEIPLEKDYGYAYAKLIFSKDVQPDYFDYRIIRVYNRYRAEPLPKREFVPEAFATDDLALYPLLASGFPNVRGPHKWRFLGHAPLTEEDRIIPDYADIGMHERYHSDSIREWTTTEFGCAIIRNFENYRIYTKDFASIRHLGFWVHQHPRMIRSCVTMYWMHRHGTPLHDHYSNDELNNNYQFHRAARRVLDYDVDFTQVTRSDRLQPAFREYLIPGRIRPKS